MRSGTDRRLACCCSGPSEEGAATNGEPGAARSKVAGDSVLRLRAGYGVRSVEEPMKVRDATTHDVRITNPDETILAGRTD